MVKIINSQLFQDFFKNSNNKKINFLVLHHIKAKNIDDAIKELKKHKVSSHYIIDDNGDIFQLVEEKNIAYHAGVSFWNNVNNLNETSIGIEFFSKDPYKIGFSNTQMQSGLELCQNIIRKYNIKKQNIVAHSDIAYKKETGFLNRKSDPSHLFDWKFFAENNVGIWPKNQIDLSDDTLEFYIGNKNKKILRIKENLKKLGYKINNLNDEFDEEFKNLTIVFNRRFNQDRYLIDKQVWFKSSSNTIEALLKDLD